VRNDKSKNIIERVQLKKQSQFIPYWVLRAAYCENEVEKTQLLTEVPQDNLTFFSILK